MRPWGKSALLMLALLASFKVTAADEDRIGTGNPVIGKAKSQDQRCQECHGVDGNSGSDRIPNHAGQTAAYLIKQLGDFQSGARTDEAMTVMADGLSTEDKADIAAYFASLPVMKGDGSGRSSLGKDLFMKGDKSRELPACASCHGESGKGGSKDGVAYPVIGGQRNVYLRAQLLAWKLGDRTNSPKGIMNNIAGMLNEDEIQAVADYVSGL